MTDITTGCIDPRSIGCDAMACAVFAEHAAGRPVPEIARRARMGEQAVRAAIVGVWHDDKAACSASRRLAREES